MPVAALLTSILRPFSAVLSFVLMIGRNIAWMALGIMVAVILLQVVMRYVFNNALAWPEEAARFCMLWMTGLIAPSAMRWGGFVAIEMLPQAMPKRLGHVLSMVLLLLSAVVMGASCSRCGDARRGSSRAPSARRRASDGRVAADGAGRADGDPPDDRLEALERLRDEFHHRPTVFLVSQILFTVQFFRNFDK